MPRILVVDDDRLFLESFGEQLRQGGFEVELVETAEEALARDPAGFDAVVCDYVLPGISGGELLRRLRVELRARTPFVLVTGTTYSDEVIDLAVRYDADFIPKPVHLPGLLEILDEQMA